MSPVQRRPTRGAVFMEALLVSSVAVAIGEIGDKTQLLALILAARFRRPVPIVLGILVATLANHFVAGAAGQWIRAALSPETLRWALGVSFLAIAAWAIKADTMDEAPSASSRNSVFAVTVIAFFLAEIGDKTQLATVALAVKYDALVQVVVGTTLGMLAANIPAVLLAEKAVKKVPLKVIRFVAAAIFAALGIAVLCGLQIG